MARRRKKPQDGERALTAADVREQFEPLTEEMVRDLTDDTSFARGQQYFRGGYIVDAALRGPTLSARSMGQSGGPYKVKVTLAGAGSEPAKEARGGPVVSYSCSCPRGGFCKHVVALLLVWVHSPEEIEARTDMATLLKDLTREELLALITDLLKREPDLERWVEIAVATSAKTPGTGSKVSINPGTIERQVASLFSNLTYEWGEAREVADKLDGLVEMGDRYADGGQWANAQVVYSTIAKLTMKYAGNLEDENGDLDAIMSRCAEGLRRCIDVQPTLDPADRFTPEMRLALFRSLYDIWLDSLDYDNLMMEEAVAELIARTATDAERAEVAKWLKAESGSAGAWVEEIASYASEWTVRPRLEFLLTLKGKERLSEEEMLAEYRRAGLHEDLAYKLLEMGRVDEAFAVAAGKLRTPYQATRFADQALKLGPERRERALRFIEDLLWEEKDKRQEDAFLDWLEKHYLEYGMAEQALDAALRHFKAAPGDRTYLAVKNAAHMPGQPKDLWAEKRPGLISTLEAGDDWDSLVNVYLGEDNVKEALASLGKLEASKPRLNWGGYGGYFLGGGLTDTRLSVAKAAERDYPDEARVIYERQAERYIDLRNRGGYQQAAELLVKVKALYARQGKEDEWREYISILRTEFKSLRALKEELDVRGLV